jgi:predicted Ser/Thr protein kinase
MDKADVTIVPDERIEAVCSGFERAWKAARSPAERPSIEEYLAGVGGSERAALLGELIMLDLEFRRRHDDTLDRQQYHSRFPGDSQAIAQAFAWLAQVEDSLAEQGLIETAPRGQGSDPSVSDDVFSAGQKVGRYTVARCLGWGGFGAVYLAEDTELGRLVAIKVPRRGQFASPEEMGRFFVEARTVAKLKHPAIVAVYDVGSGDDRVPYVVMEYVQGQSLADLLRRERLSFGRAAELTRQVAEAVHYAHTQGFVHRDLKPANVLLDAQGRPHIADFGLAVHESAQRLGAGEQSGTLAYMAPEQVRGETHRLDGRADVWALGVMLYEMLTGRRPFQGDTVQSLADEILNRDPKPPRQINDAIPEELSRICLKAIRKPATERYATALDLAADLQTAAGEGAHPRADRVSARPLRALLTPARCLAFALAVCLAAMAALWIYRLGAFAAPPPLSGTLDVLVLTPGNGAGRLLSIIKNPDARPLRPGDQVRVQAALNRPAYVYLVWIDSRGEALPVYPWTKGRWSDRPARQLPVERLSLPDEAGKYWNMQPGHTGMETLVLLARETPLPEGIDLAPLFAGLPTQPVEDPKALVIFDGGRAFAAESGGKQATGVGRSRGPNLSEPAEAEYAIVRAQALLAARLGSQFSVNRAVSFACVEKEP